MKNVQRVAVIGKSRWDMPDENGGANIKGSKIFIYDGTKVDTENKVGVHPTTFNLPFDSYTDFHTVPGVYDIEFGMKVGSKGQFTVFGAEFIEEYSI